MALIETLAPLRARGARRTTGLDDATVLKFAASHPDLVEAIAAAATEFERVRGEFPELLDLDEDAQARAVQGGYVNFYSSDTVNPYVALVARGPWIVTLKGAVLHDSGGYGMLGLGHTPKAVLEAMARPQVMANIMTPNLSQLRFDRMLRNEVGHVGDSTIENPDEALVKTQRDAKAEFCKRQSLVPGVSPGVGHAESSVATFLGPEVFGQVAQSWRSVWVVRPEGEQSASGYAFDPPLMRRLFVFGVNTFQARCKEVLGLLGISKNIQDVECKDAAGAAAIARAEADIQKCVPSSARIKPCKN